MPKNVRLFQNIIQTIIRYHFNYIFSCISIIIRILIVLSTMYLFIFSMKIMSLTEQQVRAEAHEFTNYNKINCGLLYMNTDIIKTIQNGHH